MQKTKIKSFQLNDQQWIEQLMNQGCVILKNILTQDQVIKGEDYFWQWLQSLGSGIKRNDPSTWINKNWPGLDEMGFFVSYGGCHTKTSWMIRTHPKVIEVFSKIWKTNDLITSMDTIISWKPWWNEVSKNYWNPYVQNLHLDQNPYFKNGLKCVQGMLPLKRVRSNQVGGLRVVPGSNCQEIQDQIIQRYPQTKFYGSDFVQLKFNDPLIKKGQLVECDAGDLILWDSRTVHGGKIFQPNEQFKQLKKNQLVRLSVTVCMVPKEWCSKENQQTRERFFKQKIGTTHWPHEPLKNPMGKMASGIDRNNITYQFPELTQQIRKVL